MNLFEQSVIRDTSKLQYLIEPYLTFIQDECEFVELIYTYKRNLLAV